MSARILDGRAAAAAIKAELATRLARLKDDGVVPGLGTLLVGDSPASRSYVTGKHADCAEVGIASIQVELPASAAPEQIADAVRSLKENPEVTGFIVQLPLPDGADENAILELIDPAKDADGLHPVNLGRLVLGVDPARAAPAPLPCTPAGVLELLARNNLDVGGKHVTVIGRGTTVGRPLGLILTRKGTDATVTLAHSRTPDLATEVACADIVVAAAGVPHLVKPHWVKPGAIVLDVGVTRVGVTETGKAKLAGDVDPAVRDVAGWLSPNPGGVGPMTRALLLSNIVDIAENSAAQAPSMMVSATGGGFR